MDLDRLKDLIKKYRENMKYYHDTKMPIMKPNVEMNI